MAIVRTPRNYDDANSLAPGLMKLKPRGILKSGELPLSIGKLLAVADRPADVRVTIGDEIALLDYQVGEQCTVKIVAPEDSDPNKGNISCLSPLGASLLGARIGEARQVRIFGNRFVYQILRIG